MMRKPTEIKIHTIFAPTVDTEQHVIFIHGLDGHPIKTWESDGVFWPQWILGSVPNCAIWSIGYPAAKTRWGGGQAMHITDRGKSIYHALIAEQKFDNGDLCFVGHSMGGLLIKQALVEAKSQSLVDQKVSKFLNRIKKVIFIGTPHAGSLLASVSKMFPNFARPSPATYSMGVDDPNLRSLDEHYKHLANSLRIQHLSLFETKKLAPIKQLPFLKFLVVSPASASPGVDGTVIPIDSDHESICKPSSKESQACVQLCHFLVSEASTNIDEEKISERLDEVVDSSREILSKIGEIQESNQLTHTGLFDKEIQMRLDRIRHQRFFGAFDTVKDSRELLENVVEGELSNGSQTIRASAISWCVRILSASTDIEELDSYIDLANKLAVPSKEFEVARFFIDSKKTSPFNDEISAFINSDSELKRDAAFMLYFQLHGARDAVGWFEKSQFRVNKFSPEGLVSLLQAAFNAERWDLLKKLREEISTNLNVTSPALLTWLGISILVEAVVEKKHKKLVTQPVYLGESPFAGDAPSIALRRHAIDLFRSAATLAASLALTGVREHQEEFALWLELQDEELKSKAIKEIKANMSGEPEQVVRFFPLATQYLNSETNLDAIESAINVQTTKTLGKSFHANLSRCSYLYFLCKANPPYVVLKYLTNHKAQIQKVLAEEDVFVLEFECLIGCGKLELAEDKLTEFKTKYPKSEKLKQCENMLLEAQGKDGVKLLIELYRETNDPSDLNILVITLDKKGEHELLEKYSAELFSRTKTTKSAEYYLRALNKNENFEGIKTFFGSHPEMKASTPVITFHHCWQLFRKGKIDECLRVLPTLQSQIATEDIVYLKTNCLVAIGDWVGISKMLDEAWNNKSELHSSLLMWLANLATLVLPERAKELTHFIAERDQLNPNIQLAAYSMAVGMGWEDSEKPREWLGKALKHSGEQGPVKSVPFEELIERSSEWRDKEDYILNLFNAMQAPSLMVAKSLNRTLTSFYLSPAVLNRSENDIRFQQPIPAFASYRPSLNNVPKVLALDSTSLLTLGFLQKLELVFKLTDKIYIPHSFMIWLFDELKETAYHQPSRIESAKIVDELVSAGQINVLPQETPKSVDLGLYVGDELAVLIETANSTVANPMYVVRSLPVRVAGSYTMEIADLEDNANKLLECCAIVDSLKSNGYISEQEAENANYFLKQHEQMQESEFVVETNSELLLDDLSITYFQEIGLLERLVNSDFTVSIHKQTIEHARGLIRLERQFSKVSEHLKYIQKSIATGISNGDVHLTEMSRNKSDDQLRVLADLFSLDGEVQGVVVDDRFINQHPNFEVEGKRIPTFTTLDFLKTFHHDKEIDISEHCSMLTELREAQYHLIPVTCDEIQFWMRTPNIRNGKLIENFELKVLRNYLSKLKTSNSIQLPRDAGWLLNTFKSVSHVLKSTWLTESELNEKVAISNWLYDILDYRSWAPFHQQKEGESLGESGKLVSVYTLLVLSHEGQLLNEDYSNWFTENVLFPLKFEEPAIYQMLITQCKAEIKRQIMDDSLWESIDAEQLS